MASRSHFYVDTPRDPKQRHSMFVTHSEVARSADLSSNSSSATLPSAAGSVDRLTGLEEKKPSSGFFTLKPKSSSSLRSFFRSTSSLSLSPAKRRKASKLERRDSCSQTEQEFRPEFDEVGVQTLNASTVDVPVQTSLETWDEGDRYGHKRFTYAPARTSPFWCRPSATSSALSNSLLPKNVPKDPLAAPKLIKYAVPGDSEKTALHNQSTVPPSDVNSCQPVSPSSHSVSTSSSTVPVKYFSAKELSGNSISLSVSPECQLINKCVSETPSETPEIAKDPHLIGDSNLKRENISESENPQASDNKNNEVSNDLKISLSTHADHPLSALKIDRPPDSPSRKLKSVHFELAEFKSSQNLSNVDKDLKPRNVDKDSKPRNVDKDFEALLRDLDILTDDENYTPCSLTIAPHNKIPTTNFISPNLKSALDALKEDFLAPIPENVNECNESETNIDPKTINADAVEKNNKADTQAKTAATNFNSYSESKISLNRSNSEYENQNPVKASNDSESSTSLSVFTSANSVSNPETDSLEGNVYDNVIKEENSVKAVPLPTLPSFFEPPSHPETLEITEIIEDGNSDNKDSASDNQTQSEMPLETENDRNRLSRSSSRSSVKSNSKSGLDSFREPVSRFDSCENLDQLEEEIIRSLYSPDEGKLEDSIMKNIDLPPSESFQNSGTTATHMRRVILDQLLTGKSVEEILPNYPLYQRAHSVPEKESKFKSPTKYTAVLTRMSAADENEPFSRTENNIASSIVSISNCPIASNSSVEKEISAVEENCTSIKEFDSPKRASSVFLFPENVPDADISEKSPLEISTADHQSKTSLLEVRRSSWTPQSNSDPATKGKKSPSKEIISEEKSEHCDFTSCLRPSKIQNSPFLAKINTRSMSPCNFSPTPPLHTTSSVISGSSTIKRNNSPPKVPDAVGECDFGSCLKPSQVQNSLFKAELSEITANKSTNSLRTGSPLTIRTYSPLPPRSNSLDLPNATSVSKEEKPIPEEEPTEPVKHKSECLITLQPVTKHSNNESNTTIDSPTAKSVDDPDKKSSEMFESGKIDNKPSESDQNLNTSSVVPPPPPPPPPSSSPKSIIDNNVHHSMEEEIRDQKSNLTPVPTPDYATPKTPVMVELELRLNKNDSERRNSNDKIVDECPAVTDNEITNAGHSEIKLNGSSGYISNGNQNGNGIGILSNQRENFSPITSDKNDRNSDGTTKLKFSSNTIVTDAPPPPGAVLLDKKITIDGDQVHTDKYFAIPVKEVLKEKTSTTKFIPAPPKYEGIGPTEEGIPTGLRNSVKKENVHNWYKTMFKSLHKADSANDSQEYIIGYTSEPESSKRDMMLKKKSASLDNRLKQDANSNINKPSFPVKSSIEVYNVRPRLIEDYEPGYSSITDDVVTTSKRYLPSKNTVKPSYEFKNGYESDSNITINRNQPESFTSEQQKMWYREIQKGADIPQFGLGKPAPEKLREPSIGPVPPPPLNYNGQSTCQQAVRPLTLPANYSNQNGNGYCQQMNGAYEMQMRHAIHSEMQQRRSPSSSNQLSPPIRTMMKSPSRSPDMKIPAQALFDFKAESPKEISLKKGDTVLILRQLDKNWYEGEYKGVVGIFPISYVEIIPPEHASTPIKVRTEGLGRALYDFVAQTSIELTVRKGDTMTLLRRVDANWFEGIFNNKKGIIPISYIQVLQEPIDRNISSPTQKSYQAVSPSSFENREKLSKPNSLSPSAYSSSSTSPLPVSQERRRLPSKKSSNLIEPILYRALYSYSPQNSDELELQEGDNVYVVEMCDDGWFVGTSVRSGVFGIFPGNYVEKAC